MNVKNITSPHRHLQFVRRKQNSAFKVNGYQFSTASSGNVIDSHNEMYKNFANHDHLKLDLTKSKLFTESFR